MTRVRIDRLNLRVTGIAPEMARRAAELLGPALAQAIADRTIARAGADVVDAGRVTTAASPEPRTIAAQVASRVARAAASED